jgi:hypothetical protein
MSSRDLGVAQIHTGVEHGGDKGVAKHVWVHAGDLDSRGCLQPLQTTRGGMAMHPVAIAVEQNRPSVTISDGAVDRAGHRWWHRHDDPHDAVAVFLAEVGHVEVGRFMNTQAEEPQ